MGELFDPVAIDYDAWYETEIGRVTDQVERAQVVRLFTPPGPQVLEIGCGTGQYTAWLATQGYQVTAVDISANMLEKAKEKFAATGNQVTWLCADIWEILGDLELYHGILSMTAFEFLPKAENLAAELFNHLQPGGCLVLGVIAGGSAWSRLYETHAKSNPQSVFAHARFYTEAEIRQWQVGGRLEMGRALYFPPEVSSAEQAMALEEQKAAVPGFLVARWTKV